MKDLIMAITTVLLVLATSCTKPRPDEPIDPVQIDTPIIALGKCSVLKNGVAWNGLFDAKYIPNNKKRFSIEGHLQQDGFDHYLYLDDISVNKGLQPIERLNLWNTQNGIPNPAWLVTVDLDQLLNSYLVDTTRANQYIEILRYDSVNHIVEGRFQTFLEGPTNYSFLPDSIALTEGKFHLKIEK